MLHVVTNVTWYCQTMETLLGIAKVNIPHGHLNHPLSRNLLRLGAIFSATFSEDADGVREEARGFIEKLCAIKCEVF